MSDVHNICEGIRKTLAANPDKGYSVKALVSMMQNEGPRTLANTVVAGLIANGSLYCIKTVNDIPQYTVDLDSWKEPEVKEPSSKPKPLPQEPEDPSATNEEEPQMPAARKKAGKKAGPKTNKPKKVSAKAKVRAILESGKIARYKEGEYSSEAAFRTAITDLKNPKYCGEGGVLTLEKIEDKHGVGFKLATG